VAIICLDSSKQLVIVSHIDEHLSVSSNSFVQHTEWTTPEISAGFGVLHHDVFVIARVYSRKSSEDKNAVIICSWNVGAISKLYLED